MFRTTNIKSTIILSLILLLSSACTTPKKVFFFDEPTPPQAVVPDALQSFFDHPPLYIPEGKRKTIDVFSPSFTLAIPNAMDMTGRSNDLQKALADKLYTEMFNVYSKYNDPTIYKASRFTRKITLLDRGALINLDPKIIVDSMYEKKQSASKNNEKKQKKQDGETTENIANPTLKTEFERMQINNDTIALKGYLRNADGILLTYITSRSGLQEGQFEVDYRIVINRGYKKQNILLAGHEFIHFDSNASKGIDIKREDVNKIADSIYKKMKLRAEDGLEAQVIRFDPPYIIINLGKFNNLLPGTLGYVVEWDEHLQNKRNKTKANSHRVSPRHYSYIAEFIVTDVFDETSTALLLPDLPEFDKDTLNKYHWEVKAGDVIVIK